MVWILYYFIMYLMVAGIRISAWWNPKSKQWLDGRRGWIEQLRRVQEKKATRVWFHVSSLGEFEQARPVIQKIKEQQPTVEIILTFYSPSGYQVRANYELASVFYLPADLPGVAKKWISILKPDIAVFVKYDLWPGYLKAIEEKGIPAFLISAHWIPGGWFSSWSLPPTRALLKKFKRIFLQEEEHLHFFKQLGFNNVSVAGDTRIDRSLELPSEVSDKISSTLIALGPFDLVAGSTWPPDEKLLVETITSLNLSVILAPHDVSAPNITRLTKSLPFKIIKLSEIRQGMEKPQILLVDSIGLLSVLYSQGKMAYVGGGFGSGIHNILEPMAHSKPVLFGPAFKKFPEAVAMVRQKGAFSITSTSDLKKNIAFLLNNREADKAGQRGFNYLLTRSGATTTVTNSILESIPYIGVL